MKTKKRNDVKMEEKRNDAKAEVKRNNVNQTERSDERDAYRRREMRRKSLIFVRDEEYTAE